MSLWWDKCPFLAHGGGIPMVAREWTLPHSLWLLLRRTLVVLVGGAVWMCPGCCHASGRGRGRGVIWLVGGATRREEGGLEGRLYRWVPWGPLALVPAPWAIMIARASMAVLCRCMCKGRVPTQAGA